MAQKRSTNISMLFVGVALGVSVGILFAPTQGQSLRSQLIYRIKQYTKQFRKMLAALVYTKVAVTSQAVVAGRAVTQEVMQSAKALLAEVNELTEILQHEPRVSSAFEPKQ